MPFEERFNPPESILKHTHITAEKYKELYAHFGITADAVAAAAKKRLAA